MHYTVFILYAQGAIQSVTDPGWEVILALGPEVTSDCSDTLQSKSLLDWSVVFVGATRLGVNWPRLLALILFGGY